MLRADWIGAAVRGTRRGKVRMRSEGDGKARTLARHRIGGELWCLERQRPRFGKAWHRVVRKGKARDLARHGSLLMRTVWLGKARNTEQFGLEGLGMVRQGSMQGTAWNGCALCGKARVTAMHRKREGRQAVAR